ncbi:MAG: hypothetical protein FJ137_09185 [Deltaproteobacteria bacterium]|nr:hypothetical protein [Deltaproteobacteria bacterium]
MLRRLIPSLLASACALSLLAVAGPACAGDGPKKPRSVPPPTVASSNTATPAEVEASVLAEAKKTSVEQLQCTDEETTVSCTRHDVHGGCVAVQARGCGRTLEYDFGNE